MADENQKINIVLPASPSRHPLSQRFHDTLKEMGELHDRKQSDYGRKTDPFANVNGSAEWGIRPWVGAMLRANDKIKRLQKYAQSGTLANEGARDSFLDLAVYAIIGLVLWETAELTAQLAQNAKTTAIAAQDFQDFVKMPASEVRNDQT